NFAVTVAEPPVAIVPSVHVKFVVLVVVSQVPCDGVTVPRLKPVGQLSLTLTDVASDGPALLTVIVYVCTVAAPVVTLDSPSLFVIDTSALACTSVEVVLLVLFPLVGSVVPSVATEAELRRTVPSATEEGTCT